MTEETKEDPLHPDSERLLFEKLSMDNDEFDILQFIRERMRWIIKAENDPRT